MNEGWDEVGWEGMGAVMRLGLKGVCGKGDLNFSLPSQPTAKQRAGEGWDVFSSHALAFVLSACFCRAPTMMYVRLSLSFMSCVVLESAHNSPSLDPRLPPPVSPPVWEKMPQVSATEQHVELLKTIFDFSAIKALLARADFSVLYDSMHGVQGPYAKVQRMPRFSSCVCDFFLRYRYLLFPVQSTSAVSSNILTSVKYVWRILATTRYFYLLSSRSE